MLRRKKASSGQAIVMVTVSLFAMAGMMGLAVDLGWSFFVQKAAQSAADGAALAAVQEAYKLHGGGLGLLTCGAQSACQSTPTSCAGIATGNLHDGCLYALQNGFDYTTVSSRQNVTMQADACASVPCPAGNRPPTVSGISDLKYWVTVRVVQTIPQLFSAILGNPTGTVSAIATAAILGSISPGSFYGMNHEGDCLTGDGSTVEPPYGCGVDIDVSGANSADCVDVSGVLVPGLAKQKLCAPAGIFLASRCHGPGNPVVVGCGSGLSATNGFAGQTDNGALVWAQSGTQIKGEGWVGRGSGGLSIDLTAQNWRPLTSAGNGSVTGFSGADFSDPTHALPQPPLVNASQPSCAVLNGNITTGTLGPFQYYAVNGSGNATGAPLTIGNNVIVTFDSNNGLAANCPGTVNPLGTTANANGGFSTFTFWGGLSVNGNSNTTVNFHAGEYVMAGTSSSNGMVFEIRSSKNIVGDSAVAGTLFIFTDGSYGGGLTRPAALSAVTLHQGYIDVKNVDTSLTGVTSSAPSSISDYKDILFWQDRLNSNDTLNPANADLISQYPTRPASVTDTSPQFVMEPGGAVLTLKGVIYQPRGAWFNLKSGGASAAGTVQLQLITGALTCGVGGCGSASVSLAGPAAPIQVYITALIQ